MMCNIKCGVLHLLKGVDMSQLSMGQRLLVAFVWLCAVVLARYFFRGQIDVIQNILLLGVAGASADWVLRFRKQVDAEGLIRRMIQKGLRIVFALLVTAGTITGVAVLVLQLLRQPSLALFIGSVLLVAALYSVIAFLMEYWGRVFG